RVVLRLAAHVPQLELLEAEHVGPGSAGEPVGRGAPPATQTQHDVLVVGAHAAPGGTPTTGRRRRGARRCSAGYRGSSSPSARSSPARRRASSSPAGPTRRWPSPAG